MELRIKEILKEKGLTLKDVAERTGTDSSNLASMLKKGNPKLSTLEDIAYALGVEVYELFVRNEEPVKEAAKGNQALVMLNGEVFKLTRAKDVVKLPVYVNYAELRSNLKGFIQRAEKVDRKNRMTTEGKDFKPFSMMGMLEAFEVFSLVFVPSAAVFYLTLCYKGGKYETYTYDARYEFNNPKSDDGSWDTEQLYLEIRNDIEETVKAKIALENE